MQTDPVFYEIPGFDSYDSYSYVMSNPTNFMDPTGEKMCAPNWVSAGAVTTGIVVAAGMPTLGGAFLAFSAGMAVAAAVGVTGNYTGGGGNCTSRMPREFESLLLVLMPLLGLNQESYALDLVIFYMATSHYYENYIKGHGPSFLGKLNKTELQFSMLAYHQFLQSDGDNLNDTFAILTYFLMADGVANPRFDIDEGSFFHDQFGPKVNDPKNRTATSRWTKHARRVAFSHDSWSRTYAREKKATPKWWGDARGGVTIINTGFTVLGNMAMAATGTVLFSVANATTGRKNLGRPRKWRF